MELLTWLWFVSYLLVLTGLSAYGLHRLCTVWLYWKHSRINPEPKAFFQTLPKVTVQLPVYNELNVVKRLLKAVAALNYPKDLLQIQFLDDSTDETTQLAHSECQKLQQKGFNVEFIHRDDRSGFKAGALENGLKTATGEFVFILDADFVPDPQVLQKMIHFFTDQKVGLIQTRWGHLNRNYNILTRVQAMFLDGHLELEQTARNRSGRFFTFNGTAGIWRKSCIADAGGWEHDTLTEDMDLSYRAQLKGWKFIYLNKVVTPAELPVDMEGFKSQQHRWTKGSIQVCKKVLPAILRSRFPFYIKAEAFMHLTSNFAYLLLLALCFLIFPNQKVQPELNGWLTHLIYLPIMFFGTGSILLFYLNSQKALHPQSWKREMLYLPFLIALGIGMSINNAKAVLEAVMNKTSAFVRTPKYGLKNADSRNNKKMSKYKAVKSLTPAIEFIFGCFFTFVALDAIMTQKWISFILLLPFPVGFFYTSLSSCLASPLFGVRKEEKLKESTI